MPKYIKEKTIEEKDQTIEQLINKPTTMGFHRKNGNLYLDKDKSAPGHYKIGFTCDPEARLAALNTASSAFLTTSAQSGQVLIKGLVFTTTNAGNLTIQHLKFTSGTSTVKVGSFLKVVRIA